MIKTTLIARKDAVFSEMMRLDFASIRSAYVARARVESGRKLFFTTQMLNSGYEEVPALGETTTYDGREILHVAGKSYALRPEVHAERLADAFEAAKKAQPEPETKSIVGTESLSAMVCPKCGDALQHASVCPSCAAGKLGYRHRYACVCGGVDLISKEKL